MLNINMKKALIAGAVLTALCTSAFAAERPDAPQKPSMRERVAAILNNDSAPMPPEPRAGAPKPPRMTSEQREKWEKMTPEERQEAREKFRKERQEQREKWEKMTPEQRREAMNKIIDKQKEKQEKIYKEKISRLTPEQRAEVEEFIRTDRAQRQERHEKLKKMTPEQRDAVRAAEPRRPQFPHQGIRKDGPRFNGPGPCDGRPLVPPVCPEAQQPAD